MSGRFIKSAYSFIPYAAFVGAACNLGFWSLYYSNVFYAGNETVRRFEASFPISDILFFAALVLAGIGLKKRKLFGVFFLLISSSFGLYLGPVDILFYWKHKAYFPLTVSSIYEIGLNLFCIIGGLMGMWFAWIFLKNLLAGSSSATEK